MYVLQTWFSPSTPRSLIVDDTDSEERDERGFKSEEDEQRNIAINRRRPSGANASGNYNFHMLISDSLFLVIKVLLCNVIIKIWFIIVLSLC